MPGVERVTDFGREQELRLVRGADSQEILTTVMGRTRVHGFDLVKPSLHDIFVRIAGPEALRRDENGVAAAGGAA
jgi:ABC-2 type transport system ATP-binding protein